jgi:tRNA-modifying protein YgfZ
MSDAMRLSHRRVIALTGPDTIAMLERLVTNNTSDWQAGTMRPGALLTPQGKVIAEYLALRTADGVYLDVAETAADELAKRLKLFRLRADVAVEPAGDLAVAWAPDAFEASVADPRAPGGGHRGLRPAAELGDGDVETYHARRVAAGLAEQGVDFDASGVFPKIGRAHV